jgi:hypothetical protein
VVQRHPNLIFVAITAETRSLVALSAVGLLAGSFEAVRKAEVQVVDIPPEVIAAMALQAARLSAMTGSAPLSLRHRSFSVPVPPFGRVDIGQRGAVAVAEITGIVCFAPVVTVHAQRLAGHKYVIDRLALVHALVATEAGQIAGEVKLVIEFDLISLKVTGWFFRIMMAHVAGFVVLDIMAIAAGTHVGQVVIGAATAALYLRVANIAGSFRFADMEGVRENDIALRIC